jgi:hypothetical protein
MTCSRCGAPATVHRTSYCARCLLISVGGDADAGISTGADEAPPCELLSIIGDSRRATTFLGEQTWPVRRLVALKLFKAQLPQGADAAPLLPRHPAIAPVLENGLLGGRPYLMTSYLAGGTLPECYDRHRLGARARISALIVIAEALSAAHAHGVAHGRLTASNLLCEPQPPFAVRIVDFEPATRARPGDAEFDVLRRADVAGVVDVAGTLLRSSFAEVPAEVDVATELRRVRSRETSADLRDALERFADSCL